MTREQLIAAMDSGLPVRWKTTVINVIAIDAGDACPAAARMLERMGA